MKDGHVPRESGLEGDPACGIRDKGSTRGPLCSYNG